MKSNLDLTDVDMNATDMRIASLENEVDELRQAITKFQADDEARIETVANILRIIGYHQGALKSIASKLGLQ